MRRSPVIALVSLALVGTAACGAQTVEQPQVDDSINDVASGVSYQTSSAGMRALGSDLAGVLPQEDGNLVYSPASLALAFALLREGAVGNTADAIDATIHFPVDRRESYQALLSSLTAASGDDVLEITQGMFVQEGFDPNQTYLDAVQRWYDTTIEQTDFGGPDALGDVNGWVDERTHGRIPELFSYFDPLTVLVLLNTIYLNAKWAEPFDASDTRPGVFTTGPDSTVTAQLMEGWRELDYAQGDGWQAVRIPYQDGTMSMWVLLPRKTGNPTDLLEADVLHAVEQGFDKRPVNLVLPRWDIESKMNLIEPLSELGLAAAWGGDYSGIAGSPGDLAVGQVIQQANITVGEKGTVAAAATGIEIFAISGEIRPEGVDFTADHPFAFVVMHDATGVPLFEGVVSDPS